MMDLVLDVRHLERAQEGEGREALRRVIEDVIDGGGMLRNHYAGTKDYDGFRNQNITWTRYGYGPSHGHVVMEIGLTYDMQVALKDRDLTFEERRVALAQLGVETSSLDGMILEQRRQIATYAEAATSTLTLLLQEQVRLGRQVTGGGPDALRGRFDNLVRQHGVACQHLASLLEAKRQADQRSNA